MSLVWSYLSKLHLGFRNWYYNRWFEDASFGDVERGVRPCGLASVHLLQSLEDTGVYQQRCFLRTTGWLERDVSIKSCKIMFIRLSGRVLSHDKTRTLSAHFLWSTEFPSICFWSFHVFCYLFFCCFFFLVSSFGGLGRFLELMTGWLENCGAVPDLWAYVCIKPGLLTGEYTNIPRRAADRSR